MSRFFAAALLLTALAGPPAPQSPEGKIPEARGPLAPGKDLPGPFHPYNVNGASRGLYHCLVSEYSADPVVLLFARGLEDNAALRELLTKIEAVVERNPATRLRCLVVFLNKDLPDPLADDDLRAKLAGPVDKLSADLKLTKVVLCLGGKAQLAKYDLDEAAALTAVLYRRLRIEASHAVPADKVGDDLVKTILDEIAGKLGATR